MATMEQDPRETVEEIIATSEENARKRVRKEMIQSGVGIFLGGILGLYVFNKIQSLSEEEFMQLFCIGSVLALPVVMFGVKKVRDIFGTNEGQRNEWWGEE